MIQPRFLVPAITSAAILAIAFTVGCDSKKPTTMGAGKANVAADAEVNALAKLDSQQDAASCLTVLQQLDNLDTPGARPVLSDSERSEIASFLGLTPAETTDISQSGFTQTDAAYLEECLLIRSGVSGLKIDGKTPIEKARHGFDWACRMVYLDDRVPYPAPPWMTLQTGSGVASARAYVILAAWQQLGLDGCLVGPSELKTTPAQTPNRDPDGYPIPAPIRACGVKIDKDVLLFDFVNGRPFAAADGKGVLTLAQARATPDQTGNKEWGKEPATWQVFLAPALPCLSRRMQWLETRNPGGVGAKLYADVPKQREGFKSDLTSVACDAWNPPADDLTATRVLGRYTTEETSSRTKHALRDLQRLRMVPLERMPRTGLVGPSAEYVGTMFTTPFETLRYAQASPRDLMLRGQFQQAMTSLDGTKRMVDNARTRYEQDKGLQKDFEAWTKQFGELSTAVNRAKLNAPAEVPVALRALESFRRQPQNLDIERAFVYGNASRLLGAEVTFLVAMCVQERAERAHLDAAGSATGLWQNAHDWWDRFLDADTQAGSPFPSRVPHAKVMQARCGQFTKK